MFEKYLFSKPAITAYEKIKNVLSASFTNILWMMLIMSFLRNVMPDEFIKVRQTFQLAPNFAGMFFFGVIWAPIWEEAAFRFAPITIAKAFDEQFIFPVIIISSVLFGWGHGNGAISLLLQGVSGMIASILYIKNNYSYISTVSFHAIWNFMVMILFPYFFGH